MALDCAKWQDDGSAHGRAVTAARCQEVADLCRAPRSAGILQLLIDDGPGMFRKDIPFSFGARTSHFAKRLPEVMQRAPKDREIVRDGLIRPLRAVGAVECVTYTRDGFVAGHATKSPNCGYRLAADMRAVLEAPASSFAADLATWIAATRRRQVAAIRPAPAIDTSGHAALIASACQTLIKHHISGFRPVFVDDADGDRVSAHEAQALAAVGLDLQLADAYPDAILYNDATREVWFVEAVTSDGEIDHVKLDALHVMVARWGVKIAGATTAYATWADFCRRKAKGVQIADGTSIWVAEEAGRLMHLVAAAW